MKKLMLMLISCLYALAVSAQVPATTTSSPANNPGHTLPEVQITEQKSLLPEIQAKGCEFVDYVNSVKEKILNNDRIIASLKLTAMKDKAPLSKKSIRHKREVSSLEEVNDELKVDLDLYIKYGLGKWTKFQKEFNEDLAFLERNLNELTFVSGDPVAQNTK